MEYKFSEDPGAFISDTDDLGNFVSENRTKLGMTQDELAKKCGTKKEYISRIENNGSDIRLSTLQRIFKQGFGKSLVISIRNSKNY